MTPPRRRPRRAAAVVGLLAGVALLLGAVLDGGMASPTRTDAIGASAAVPHGDLAATTAQPREDRPTWGRTLLPSVVVAVLAGALALAMASPSIGGRPPASGPRHRAPALRAARHRGPPALV